MLVTLEDAKLHLHITDPARDPEVAMVLDHAEDTIVNFLKAGADPTWDETSTPARVQRGVLLLCGLFWEDRDGQAGPALAAGVWDEIGRLLARDRDPALA